MGGVSGSLFWKQSAPEADTLFRAVVCARGWEVRDLPDQKWNSATATISGIRDHLLCYVGPSGDGWFGILLASGHDRTLGLNDADLIACELSRRQSGPVILFSEVDQSAWGYELFVNGQSLDWFWNRPPDTGPPTTKNGNVSLLASTFGVAPETIAPYLQPIDWSEFPGTAFPDDEYELTDHWVRVDFMRRLGIHHPCPSSGVGRHMQVRRADS